MKLKVAGLVMVIAALAARDVVAQRRGLVDISPDHYRHGFWLSGGLGWGQEAYKYGSDPYSEGLGKPTFSLAIGGTPDAHVRLGGEATVWMNEYQDFDTGENITETLSSVMLTARVFPVRTSGFYLKGGAGLGVTAADVDFGFGSSETGFGTVLGAGYELKLGRSLFIAPEMTWHRSTFEKRGDDTLHERLVNFSVGITWQPGR
jgi:hypothetical protein